jgi:hypothetical protein
MTLPGQRELPFPVEPIPFDTNLPDNWIGFLI